MFAADWHTGRTTIPISRIFEHTTEEVAARYRANGRTVYDDLSRLPCIFCEEGKGDEVAYIGQINRLRTDGRMLDVELSFDPDVPPLTNALLMEHRRELGLSEFEFNRNHWAVKDADLYKFLLRRIRPRRQRPTVFDIPEHENIEPALASAMMPFGAAFNAVYAGIQQASANVGLRCRRADDIWENAKIIQDVVALIDRSRIVICDCTGKNPNVFYEAGIAHTLGREVIIITQNEHDIPFDLRQIRHIRYLDNAEGHAALRVALEARMRTILCQQN